MCSFQMIYREENGYLARCKHCRHFHLGYGSNIFAFTFDQLKSFISTIDEYYEAYRNYDNLDSKVVQIPTVARSIMLLYSLNELRTLNFFLHRTEEKLLKENLFLFHNN